MQVAMLKLATLSDASGIAKLTTLLESLNGVQKAEVSHQGDKATVTFDETQVSPQRIKVELQDAGYALAKPVHGEDGACCGGCGG